MVTPAEELAKKADEIVKPMTLGDFTGVFVLILILVCIASLFFPCELACRRKSSRVVRTKRIALCQLASSKCLVSD